MSGEVETRSFFWAPILVDDKVCYRLIKKSRGALADSISSRSEELAAANRGQQARDLDLKIRSISIAKNS